MVNKWCPKCKKLLPSKNFYKRWKSLTGLSPWCRKCMQKHKRSLPTYKRKKAKENIRISHILNPQKVYESGRKSHLKTSYGISLKDYDDLLASQDGVCAICGDPPGFKKLFVDHDHETKKVRGLLCLKCNLSLGCLKENTVIIKRLLEYIIRFNLREIKEQPLPSP